MAVEAKNFGIEGVKKALHENDSLESFDSQTLAKFCQELQIKTSGTKKELIKRLLPLKDEDLFDRRVNSICKEYKFSTALSREDIPPPAAGWKCDTLLFPKVQKEVIKKYQSSKRQGMIGQFRKAQRMFSSRRMKTIKAFKDGNKLFVKSTILKSFSSEVTRTATLLFVNNIPLKGFCECPVGKCGLCCHVIVILLQLEHLTLFNELFLSLTCTQKLQKWHRPTKCSKSKITTACHIRLKYFRNARSARQVVNTQRRQKKKIATSQGKVDSCRDQSDWLKRDVSQMSSKVSDGISKCNVDVSNHFLQTLQKYGIKQSGLYSHLSFRSAYLSEIIHKEHDYAKQTPTNDESILKSTFTAESEDIWHRALVTSNASKSNKDISTDHYTSTDSVCNENFFCPEKTQTLLNLLTESQDEIITVKIPELKEVKPSLRNNQYIDVAQGTPEWLATRVGVITASKLPSLLGFCGNKEFDSSWFCIHNKVDERICRPKKFKNFQRGNSYEKEALQSFSELTGKLNYSPCLIYFYYSKVFIIFGILNMQNKG